MNDFSYPSSQELIAHIATLACDFDYLVIHSSFRDLRFLGGTPRDFLKLTTQVSNYGGVSLTPCFNLDAQKPIQFITDSTPPSSNLGALPMHQFKKMKSNKAIFRIRHPIHSYLVEGETPDKDYLKNTISTTNHRLYFVKFLNA